jgi:hypothetical protein
LNARLPVTGPLSVRGAIITFKEFVHLGHFPGRFMFAQALYEIIGAHACLIV